MSNKNIGMDTNVKQIRISFITNTEKCVDNTDNERQWEATYYSILAFFLYET